MRHQLLPPEDPRWRELIESSDESQIVHHPAWSRLLCDSFGGDPVVLGVLDGEDRLQAGLPLVRQRRLGSPTRAVALPYTDLCPPVGRDPGSLPALAGACQSARDEGGWHELRVCWPLPVGGARTGVRGFRHQTPLKEDPDEVFGSFKKTAVRQRIRRAERLGVEVERAGSWEQMRAFYELHVMTRSRLGALVEPLRHFRLLWDRLVQEDLASLLLARHEGAVVAGALLLHWNGHVYYQYGASDPAAWDLRPNNLLMWEAIRRGCQRGDRVFDWGFTDGNNDGLRNFKGNWGTVEQEVHHTVLADTEPAASRIGPWISTLILRTSPWFCRLAGELLYARIG